MVTIHTPELAGKDAAPIMHIHSLTALKDTRTFKEDEKVDCWITRMSDKRYAVTDANFLNFTKHYEVFTETELHESFSE